MPLTTDQQTVADMFNKFLRTPDHSEMVIKGYPGCGKSYLTRYLIDSVRASNKIKGLISPDHSGTKIFCTATTNKAAEVLSNASGMQANTIHSLLGLKVSNNITNGKTSLKKTTNYTVVHNSIVFVDEASQENTQLYEMIKASTMDCKTVHIGDPYQLTNVNETTCPVFTKVKLQGELTSSKRFAASGPIADLAIQLRKTIDTGIFEPIVPDGQVIKHCTGPEFQMEVESAYSKPGFQRNDAKVVAWSNATVKQYNTHIRKLFYSDPAPQAGEVLVASSPVMSPDGSGKSLMTTESTGKVSSSSPGNEYGLDGYWVMIRGVIKCFVPSNQIQLKNFLRQAASDAKKSGSWAMYFMLKEHFADLRPTHASTVYKAQGSTYKKVFINLSDIGKCNQPNVVARMLHVAVTRASDKVYLYGELPPKYRGL